MAKEPHRFLMIDTHAFFELRAAHSLEVIGAAFSLIGWLSLGGADKDLDGEHAHAIAKLSRRRWAQLKPQVAAAIGLIMESSEPRHRFGRSSLSAATRERILERDGRVCTYCGAAEGPFHIDHRIPVARGGSDRDDNLCVACAPCNFSKSANLVSEWNW